MDFRDESVVLTDSKLKEAEVTVDGGPRSSEPSSASLGTTSDGGEKPFLEKTIIYLSSGSRSSTDSYDTVFEPRNTNVIAYDASANNLTVGRTKPKHVAHNSSVGLEDHSFSVRSSYEVSDATRESILLSPRQCPPLQVMDRSAGYDPGRISSSVFTANSSPQEWSVASNESLFSLHVGNISFNKERILVLGAPSQKSLDEVKSNRPSLLVAVDGTRRPALDEGEHHGQQARTENGSQDVITVQKITERMDEKESTPKISWNPPQNSVKIQPFPPPVKKKSSCCKKLSCGPGSCASFSCCCSKPRCHCKMPSCSCRSCSLSWCCNWNCCSKNTCCTNWNCCSKPSCCPKGSCCPSCSHCTEALCCWKWSCWKLFCCWNWGCWNTCCHSWSCCSKGPCCESWNCCSKGACCCNWNFCSEGACCESWNCCSKGSCCGGWSCCSKGSCYKSWNCCSCSSWSCCMKGSCCPTWDCCSKGMCCGSCCQDWKCCSTGLCCCNCKSFKLTLCCFSSSTNPGEGRGRSENAQHYKTKKMGKTGLCRWLSCSCC